MKCPRCGKRLSSSDASDFSLWRESSGLDKSMLGFVLFYYGSPLCCECTEDLKNTFYRSETNPEFRQKEQKAIRKILVANRGEIAVRVMRSCKEKNIDTVAVFSEADRTSMHVSYADYAVCIGPAASGESYLCIEKIISAAKSTGADAIHPGYGFLSENADFARRCKEENILFIGPEAESIETMGDKISARRKMMEIGVPVVPGTTVNADEADLLRICRRIGLPIIIKASAGGGGKGMRLVRKEEELLESYRAAKSEAAASFSSDEVYIEKYIENPHHVEIQFLGDRYGNVVHLFDRECSVQRRHQKIIEESPSPFITDEVRRKMGEITVKAAKAVHYVGAGTMEFLVDNDMNFYFLEMNTRLQVEHPVTEEVLGIDLVKEQIDIADGCRLRFRQEDLHQRGHAIECRICAEDTDNGFMPTAGTIGHIRTPQGIGVRVDSFIYDGYEIPMHYDSMLGKLIVWATQRNYALERMRRVLYEYKITGVKTNIDYLRRIMDTHEFINGIYTTNFINENNENLKSSNDGEKAEKMAVIAAYIDFIVNKNTAQQQGSDICPISRWRAFSKQKGVLRI